MSDVVLVAVITAAAGVIGGIVGAIGSPIGKDWVSRREFERTSAREEAVREREAAELAAEKKRRLPSGRPTSAEPPAAKRSKGCRMPCTTTIWRGEAGPRTTQAGRLSRLQAAAWNTSRRIEDQTGRNLVDGWRKGIDRVAMRYTGGPEPPDRENLLGLYTGAAEHLGELLRPAVETTTGRG